MLSLHGQTMLYGIFGYPIGHSLSPLMHNTAFVHYGIEAIYLPFAVQPAHLSWRSNRSRLCRWVA